MTDSKASVPLVAVGFDALDFSKLCVEAGLSVLPELGQKDKRNPVNKIFFRLKSDKMK